MQPSFSKKILSNIFSSFVIMTAAKPAFSGTDCRRSFQNTLYYHMTQGIFIFCPKKFIQNTNWFFFSVDIKWSMQPLRSFTSKQKKFFWKICLPPCHYDESSETWFFRKNRDSKLSEVNWSDLAWKRVPDFCLPREKMPEIFRDKTNRQAASGSL